MSNNTNNTNNTSEQEPASSASQGDESGSRNRTQVQQLLTLTGAWERFHDANGTAYVSFVVEGRRQTWPVNASAVRDVLMAQFLSATKRPPHDRAIGEVLRTLEAVARFEGSERAVFRRVASHENCIYVDLCDSEWRSVRVQADGWQVCRTTPVRFIRSPGMLPLPEPTRGGTIAELRPFVNLEHEEDRKLLVAWLVFAFRPTGPYPILVQYGGEGTAKSTTTRVVRSLIDPNQAPLRSLPRDERDLAIAATNGWVLAFDNVSRLPDWLSDALCRVATGSGFATRRLYTDAEEARFAVQRPILMNGIETFVRREDFLSRAIRITLPRISDDRRRPEAELWATFEVARPRILGALLDAVVGALRSVANVQIAHLPRMADFARWSTAAESSLGWQPGTFVNAYSRNLDAGAHEVLDDDPLTAALLCLLENPPEWRGSTAELLRVLNEQRELDILAGRPPSDWPPNPRALTSALQRREGMLRRVGVRIERQRLHQGRVVVLRRQPVERHEAGDNTPEVA